MKRTSAASVYILDRIWIELHGVILNGVFARCQYEATNITTKKSNALDVIMYFRNPMIKRNKYGNKYPTEKKCLK
jgi:hypothetical protein